MGLLRARLRVLAVLLSPRGPGALLLGVLCVAAALRFWHISDLGLTHFDEGHYALAGRAIAEDADALFSELPVYFAPAVWPVSLAVAFKLFGAHDWVAIALAGLCGVLTVAAVYLLGARLYDRRVGVTAALFLACNCFHLFYSRMALTEAMFLLTFTLALLFVYAAHRERDLVGFGLAGLATGLCMHVKYSGSLPLLLYVGVLALEAARCALRDRAKLGDLGRRALGAALALGIAALCYLPWVLYVERLGGGYAALAAHQSAYSLGRPPLIRTPPTVVLAYLSRWTSPLLLAAAALGALHAWRRPRLRDRFLIAITAGYAASVALYESFPRLGLPLVVFLSLLAGVGLARGVRGALPARRRWVWIASAGTVATAELFVSVPHLALSTNGYREAGMEADKLDGDVFKVTATNFDFYSDRARYLEDTPELRRELAAPRTRYVVVDDYLSSAPKFPREVFFINPTQVQWFIPNSRYEVVRLQKVTHERLAALDGEPDGIIRILRLTGPVRLP